MSATTKSADFKEVQTFRGTWVFWLTLIIVGCALGPMVIMGSGEILDGTAGLEDFWKFIVSICIPILVLWFLWVLSLSVSVTDEGIRYRFFPLAWGLIRFDEIEGCEARTYRPIREYGGWGIRYGLRGGKAYNVKGNQGVQLVLKNGRRILFGSQCAEELAAAIQARVNGIK